MALQSICPEITLPDAREDYRTARKVEQYRISRNAFYFAGFPRSQYIPLAAVRRAWVRDGNVSATGCCGSSLPIAVLRLKYVSDGKETYRNFTFDRRPKAEQVLEVIREAYPDVSLEPELGPAADTPA